MTTTFKAGDIVTLKKSEKDSASYLTFGKNYKVTRGTDDEGDITLIDDEGYDDYYLSKYFELASIINSIPYAQSIVNTNVVIKKSGKRVKIAAFSTWNKFYTKGLDKKMLDLIKKDGYVVTVEGEDGTSYCLDEISQLTNEVVLNDEYTAVIEGDIVKVGCQDIPIDKVKEILDAYNKLND
jgi:signal peptidase I